MRCNVGLKFVFVLEQPLVKFVNVRVSDDPTDLTIGPCYSNKLFDLQSREVGVLGQAPYCEVCSEETPTVAKFCDSQVPLDVACNLDVLEVGLEEIGNSI